MDEVKDEAAADGAGRVASLFVTSLVGGLVAVFGVVELESAHPVHGASAEARALRAQCQALGVTPEELARREGGR